MFAFLFRKISPEKFNVSQNFMRLSSVARLLVIKSQRLQAKMWIVHSSEVLYAMVNVSTMKLEFSAIAAKFRSFR